MDGSKRKYTSQSKTLFSKKTKNSTSQPRGQTQISNSSIPENTQSSSTPSVGSQADSVDESPSECSPLTLEEAQESMESMIKRCRSWVWDHFERYIHCEKGVYSVRCKCPYCKKADYPCDTTANGTKTLSVHLLFKCKEYPPNKEKLNLTKQKVLSFDNPTKKCTGFNQKRITKACVEMIIVDELPFSFVEGKGFRHFCDEACPSWRVPCRQTIAREVLNLYYSEKRELRDKLSTHRVCITTDTWTSCQNINYMVVTSHFIDVDWMLHKKIISFCVIPNHKGESISRLLEECLLDWGIEKLLTVTVDNASANDAGLVDLIKRMSRWNNSNALVLGGENLHVRCVAHILNLIVKDGLGKLNSCIQSIRNAVRYVRSSPQRQEAFKTCVEKVKIDSKGIVSMDVPTRWNSTYLMLQSALKFRSAFDRLRDDDTGYESYFSSNTMIGPLNDIDWGNAEMFANFLKPFYDITLRVCCSLTPTVHQAFMDILDIYSVLHEPIETLELNPNETLLDSIRTSMQSKYHKYWGDLKKVNQYFFLAIVLDPRHKLDSMFDAFVVACGDDNDNVVEAHVNDVKGFMNKLYSIYAANVSMDVQVPQSERNSGGGSSSSCISSDNENSSVSSLARKKFQELSLIRRARKSGIIQNDVDRYLSDDIEADSNNFQILDWWRVNESKYPILALMARDILAIPVSTIASESCFSTSGRIIDSFRSSLSPKMVEALICTQNWLTGSHVALDHALTTEEVEFCENLEKEVAKDANSMLPPKDKS